MLKIGGKTAESVSHTSYNIKPSLHELFERTIM